MKFGLPISFTIHAAAVFGGLLLWEQGASEFPEVKIINLNLVSVTDKTNIKPTRKKPPKEEPPKEELLADTPKPPPISESPVVPEVITDNNEDVPTPKLPPKFDLDAIANQLGTARENNLEVTPNKPLQNEITAAERADTQQSRAGEGTGNEINSEDYIRQAMQSCWQIDEGMKGYDKLKVRLRVTLDIDGRVTDVDVLNNARIIASGNASWQAAREKAISGVYECEASFSKLPKGAYEDWKSTELTFDPGAMK